MQRLSQRASFAGHATAGDRRIGQSFASAPPPADGPTHASGAPRSPGNAPSSMPRAVASARRPSGFASAVIADAQARRLRQRTLLEQPQLEPGRMRAHSAWRTTLSSASWTSRIRCSRLRAGRCSTAAASSTCQLSRMPLPGQLPSWNWPADRAGWRSVAPLPVRRPHASRIKAAATSKPARAAGQRCIVPLPDRGRSMPARAMRVRSSRASRAPVLTSPTSRYVGVRPANFASCASGSRRQRSGTARLCSSARPCCQRCHSRPTSRQRQHRAPAPAARHRAFGYSSRIHGCRERFGAVQLHPGERENYHGSKAGLATPRSRVRRLQPPA